MYDYRYNIYRNTGIFREPGVFACLLAIGSLFELAKNEKCNVKKIIVFVACILTTFSTAGFIIGAVILLYLLLFALKISSSKKIIILLLAFCGFLVLFNTQRELVESVLLNKFMASNNTYGSWFARYQSIFGNLSIALKNPLFGIGRYSLYEITLATQGNYEAIDNTNTLLINFSAFGILYGTIMFVGSFLFFSKHDLGLLKSISLFLILFIALSNEDLGQNIIYFFSAFVGLLPRTIYSNKYPIYETRQYYAIKNS